MPDKDTIIEALLILSSVFEAIVYVLATCDYLHFNFNKLKLSKNKNLLSHLFIYSLSVQ